MYAYIIRKYKEESKLPLDLRSPRYNPKTKVFWDYVKSEEIIVDPNISYLDHIPSHFESDVFVGNSFKSIVAKRLYIGSLVAVVLCSKSFVYNRESSRIKFRIFYGHCIWSRCNWIQLRVRLANAFFRMNFNFFIS